MTKTTATKAKPKIASAKPAAKARVVKPKVVVPKKPHGRPSKFTEEIASEIVSRIATGEPLRQIARDDHMPHWTEIYDWMERDKQFSLRIAHARERGEEAIAQECMEIADNAKNDWMEKQGKDGADLYQLNGEHIQRSKLRIETRLKLLAKWNPRKWGEKLDMNHGVQPDNPLAKLLENLGGNVIGKNVKG